MPQLSITFRQWTPVDSFRVFNVVEESLADLNRRIGSSAPSSFDSPEKLEKMWEERRPLFDHLANSAERGNQTIGYARSIRRDGLRILTELFVLPSEQSTGVGKQLLARAFPNGDVEPRIIISSPDQRAQALYRKIRLSPRFSLHYFWRKPVSDILPSDLEIVPLHESSEQLRTLALLDKLLLGHWRDVDHRWLLSDRQGYLYFRDNDPVGYGYIGRRNGPFALMHSEDFPAVLAHAESQAAAEGYRYFGFEIPDINEAALAHITARGFQSDKLVATFMSGASFGKFENYIVTRPPFIL